MPPGSSPPPRLGTGLPSRTGFTLISYLPMLLAPQGNLPTRGTWTRPRYNLVGAGALAARHRPRLLNLDLGPGSPRTGPTTTTPATGLSFVTSTPSPLRQVPGPTQAVTRTRTAASRPKTIDRAHGSLTPGPEYPPLIPRRTRRTLKGPATQKKGSRTRPGKILHLNSAPSLLQLIRPATHRGSGFSFLRHR